MLRDSLNINLFNLYLKLYGRVYKKLKNYIDQNKVPQEILNILENIFLDNTLEEIINSSSFEELEDWDSLTKMSLGFQLEKVLKRKLSLDEMESISSVKTILKFIYKNE